MAKWIIAIAFLACTAAELLPASSISYNYPASSPIPALILPGAPIPGPIATGGFINDGTIENQRPEGYFVDPDILHKVKVTLLRDEIENSGSSSYQGIISNNGVPLYRVPNRVVGIELGPVRQAMQIDQYHQQGYISRQGSYISGGFANNAGYK